MQQDQQIFSQDLQKKLAELDQKREELLEDYRVRRNLLKKSLWIILAVTVLIWFLNLSGLTMFCGFAAIGVWLWSKLPEVYYKKAYREQILPNIASMAGDVTYNAEDKIAENETIPSGIFPKHNFYSGSDLFTGVYKGVQFKISNIRLYSQKTRMNNSAQRLNDWLFKNFEIKAYHPDKDNYIPHGDVVFQGVVVLIETPHKTFHGQTLLLPDEPRLFEWVRKKTTGLKKANLVDTKFEDRFDVMTNDQVEARYLVGPAVMEQFLSLAEDHRSEELAASYFQNKVLVRIKTDDPAFEPPSLKDSSLNKKNYLKLKAEIEDIISIIEKLDLHKKSA